jgi:hypothetical protein
MPTLRTPPFAQLAAALRAWAKGLYTAEGGVELLIAHSNWLHRPAFLAACCGPCDRCPGVESMWWVDWDKVAAFEAPCSSSEDAIRLIAAELAGVATGRPLAELLTSLDVRNLALVLDAVAHVGGWHERTATHIVTGWVNEWSPADGELPGDDR